MCINIQLCGMIDIYKVVHIIILPIIVTSIHDFFNLMNQRHKFCLLVEISRIVQQI